RAEVANHRYPSVAGESRPSEKCDNLTFSFGRDI
ncbi:MAG: hypothetical protein ACI8Y6_000301, partial [Brevundimonas sp.]